MGAMMKRSPNDWVRAQFVTQGCL